MRCCCCFLSDRFIIIIHLNASRDWGNLMRRPAKVDWKYFFSTKNLLCFCIPMYKPPPLEFGGNLSCL